MKATVNAPLLAFKNVTYRIWWRKYPNLNFLQDCSLRF